MITLAADCLLVEMTGGEIIPCSAEMIGVEVAGDVAGLFDEEFVGHATKAVFHYFRHELGRETVSVGELAAALDKVLRGFAMTVQQTPQPAMDSRVLESDLRRLAQDSGAGRELVFFPRLRAELRQHLQRGPRVLRFRGLRGCVKHLAGARRWSGRCRTLQVEIVGYLRHCLSAEATPKDFSLVVE